MPGKPQSQAQWEETMARRILDVTRSGLYLHLRYLSPALATLPWQAAENGTALYTEGAVLHFLPTHVIELYRKNPRFLSRAYLHTLLHCIFRHLWLRNGRDAVLWNLSSDIAVEYVIDHLGIEELARPLSWTRQKLYRELEENGLVAVGPAYRLLAHGQRDAREMQKLFREFYVDDHDLWPGDGQQPPQVVQAARNWEKLGRQVEAEQSRRQTDPGEDENLLSSQIKAGRSRRSYRDFLRRFAVLREEPRLDPDNFDLGFYSYGLQIYGDMPLIEPLETRESIKVHDLVIVLDTSQSTSGELVKGFLTETFTLLRSTASFFARCHIRVLQCDDAVRQDTLLTAPEELERYLDSFQLLGGGGTDFRPAFAHVDELVAAGKMAKPRGLLYFTDGKGIFPARRPDYETAFLFLGQGAETPPWAIRLVLDEEEFAPAPPPADTTWADPDDWQPDEHIM